MRRFRAVSIVAVGVLVIGLASVAVGMKEQPRPLTPPDEAVGRLPVTTPFVIVQQGGTTWVQPHSLESECPGDTLGGHGGEGEGGPNGAETWCFEGATWPEDGDPTDNGENVTVSDTCGDVAPWTYLCFDHVDVRKFPSQTGINFWHVDSYNASAQPYIGSYSMWCGSDSLWTDGNPVECGVWVSGKYPGYGNQWNCVAQLELTGYNVANGCTLYFDPRYDTECKYDYFYCDVWDGSEWQQVALFNGCSSNPGSECGQPTGGNPDYWGNTDSGQPNSADWQPRSGGDPAFGAAIDTLLGTVVTAPKIRWRFTSDGAWSDADGRGNTSGACQIDNVIVKCDAATYTEDFEGGPGSLGAEWSLPAPDGVAQAWHQVHDSDAPYEGGDGGERTTCVLDSSVQWKGRPDGGYPGTASWRNGWYYRLLSPAVPITNTGAVVQYDQFMCTLEYTCDYTDTRVRFYDTAVNTWCPWVNIDGYIRYGGCFFWNFDTEEEVTPFYGPTADSMQFCWDLMDVSAPTDFCRGKHKQTELIVDNVSIGFFDGNATIFSARGIDLLQDSFHDSLPGFNSSFDPYDLDTLNWYSEPYTNTIRKDNQLYLDVSDKDRITEVRLYGSIDEGATWQWITMNQNLAFDPGDPALGGEYNGTLYPTDFGLPVWVVGTEIWYYVRCEDQVPNFEYFPAEANPAHPDHEGTREDNFTWSIMPMFPVTYTGPKILLVDGYGRRNYDYSECMAASDNIKPLEDIYEETLRDAGYCFDKFDISGAGSNVHIHPLQYGDYDAVVWFCGPYFSNYLFDKEAQEAIRDYLAIGGKVVLAGDRIAYNMADPAVGGVGEDSLGGEFLDGIMGATYRNNAEMEGAFVKPYVYLKAAAAVTVLGTPVAINPTLLDTILVYRECPYLKDMSYVVTNSSPPAGYTAQPLLYVLNPDPAFSPSDGAIYVESQGSGQCVFVNYDFCAIVNHYRSECNPASVPAGLPTHLAGYYYGRVALMRTILEELFGLPSQGAGQGGTSGTPEKTTYRWALSQNSPNPCAVSTKIRFEVAKTTKVSIKVYNAMGQLVTTLADKRMEPGRHELHWDGKNASGERVSSGVYFYKMHADRFQNTRKMLVLR
jgi:hypothetical protein